MTKKFFFLVTIIFVLAFVWTSPVQADKRYSADRFDVQVDIQPDATLLVTESIAFRFEGGPFTYAFREIALTETDGVQVLEASLDGAAMSPGNGAGQVEVVTGSPVKVTWHFAPTSDATHEFVLRYRVAGVIRKLDADTLIWRAIPDSHDYSIASSSVTLTYPLPATLLAAPTLNRSYESAALEPGLRLSTTHEIGADQDVILTARFTAGSLVQAAPAWQERQVRTSAATSRALPWGILAGLAALFLGGFGIISYASNNRREMIISPVTPLTNPPGTEPPAVVGKLLGQPNNFMGTLFDLAQRGVLEITQENGWLGSKKHFLTRNSFTETLLPHEQTMLSALFKPGQTQIKMEEIAPRMASQQKQFDALLEEELVQRGWFDAPRKRQRTRLTIFWVMALFASILMFAFGAMGMGFLLDLRPDLAPFMLAVVGISASVFILSIAGLIYTASFSVLTPSGEEQAARWKGFKSYLKQVSRGKEPAIRVDTFETYLPFAAVFALGTAWAKYFQKLGGVPLPVWLHAAAGSDADFGAMVAVMTASDSSGASGGGAGGGGASGGGSSGAG